MQEENKISVERKMFFEENKEELYVKIELSNICKDKINDSKQFLDIMFEQLKKTI